MIKGRNCKNPPYRTMTDGKWESLGQTITIKKALDLWWNSIRVRTPNGMESRVFTIYKCYDGDYDIANMADWLEIDENDLLKCKITLDEGYDEDSDGYPIVFATLQWGREQ